jgi:beta-glucanase (GH16 family)
MIIFTFLNVNNIRMKYAVIAGIMMQLLTLLSPAVYSQAPIARSTADAGDLIWSDEFDGTGDPDPGKWECQNYNRRNNSNGPDGWWSSEDTYLDGNGNLVIRCRKIGNRNDDDDTCDYSTGNVRTKEIFEQQYGRFEIRCKLPTQPGWWVAFWMMQGDVSSVGEGGVDGTEVDIMEGFGWNNRINLAFHWDGYGDDHQSTGKQFYPAGIREGFHTFALEWYPEMYIFFIDGEEKWRTTGGGVCNRPGYIKVTGELSTEDWAINSYWANNPAGAVFPDSFVVDYVRVYEVGDYQPPVSTGDRQGAERVNIYPNPAGDRIYIKWDPALFNDPPTMEITDLAGHTVRSLGGVANAGTVSVADLDSGLYFITLRSGEAVVKGKFTRN